MRITCKVLLSCYVHFNFNTAPLQILIALSLLDNSISAQEGENIKGICPE